MKLKQHILKSMILVTCDETEDTFYIKEIALNLFAVESTAGGESYADGTVYSDICEAMKYIKQTIAARKFINKFYTQPEPQSAKDDDLPFNY